MRVTTDRRRCARVRVAPEKGAALAAAGHQGHLASRFRSRTKL